MLVKSLLLRLIGAPMTSFKIFQGVLVPLGELFGTSAGLERTKWPGSSARTLRRMACNRA